MFQKVMNDLLKDMNKAQYLESKEPNGVVKPVFVTSSGFMLFALCNSTLLITIAYSGYVIVSGTFDTCVTRALCVMRALRTILAPRLNHGAWYQVLSIC